VVKDVTYLDLALIELLNDSRTDAPPDVLEKLQAQGFLELVGDRPKLTAAGRDRAERLKPGEREMRLMWSGLGAGGSCGVRTVGGSGVCVGGGRASIRS